MSFYEMFITIRKIEKGAMAYPYSQSKEFENALYSEGCSEDKVEDCENVLHVGVRLVVLLKCSALCRSDTPAPK